MKRNTQKFLAILLAVITIFTTMTTPALAAEHLFPGDPGSLTERFIDEATGRELETPVTSKSNWVKDAPGIDGYEYHSFSQETSYIYSQEDITYITGYPDKTVGGDRNLRRDEAAVIFYRLYDGVYPEPVNQMTGKTFPDVKPGWYYKQLEMCYNLGIIAGGSDGKFHPEAPITRAEFATIVSRFAQLDLSYGESKFSDVKPGHWAYRQINAAAEAGWIAGYPDGTFRPNAYIQRSEASALINSMMNRKITAAELKALGVTNPYVDLVETYWAYGDLLEATIRHAAADWHELNYNEDELNKVIERFVDEDDKEIAPQAVTNGQTDNAPRQYNRKRYLGYTTVITYVYSQGSPELTVSKMVDKTDAKVGDTLVYTITVGNTEGADAAVKNAVVSDILPQHLSFVYGSVQIDNEHSDYSFDPASGDLVIPVGDLAPGKSRTVSFRCLIKDTAYGQTLENTAAVTADNTSDPVSSTATTSVEKGKAAFSATKTVDKKEAKVGETLTYTITASNEKNATAVVKNAVVSDTLPAGLDFIQGSAAVDGESAKYTFEDGSLTMNLGDLQPGEAKRVTFQAVVNKNAYGQNLQNTAIIRSDDDSVLTPSDPGVPVEKGKPELSSVKTVDKTEAKVGDTLAYTITAENGKNATAPVESAVVRDALPEGLSFVHGSVLLDGKTTAYAYDAETRTLSVMLGTLASGESHKVSFAAVILDSAYGKDIRNTAVVAGSNVEETPSTDPGVKVKDGEPELTASKKVDKSKAKVGETLTYTITASNKKEATASVDNAVLSDTLPAGLDFVQGSVAVDGESGQYSFADGTLTVSLGEIAPGGTKTVTFQAVVNKDAYGQQIQNTAIIKGDNADVTTPTDTPVSVEDGEAELSAAKAVDKKESQVGDTLTYTITVSNAKSATASVENAVVRDVLSAELNFLYGSVQVDGKSAPFSYDEASRTLAVELGNIAPAESRKVTFSGVILASAYGKTVKNTAIVKGDNAGEVSTSEAFTQVEAGKGAMRASKSVDKKEASVGDTLTYTVQVENAATATAPLKNVVLRDPIPGFLTYQQGSILMDGEPVRSQFDTATGELTAYLGDIAPDETRVLGALYECEKPQDPGAL